MTINGPPSTSTPGPYDQPSSSTPDTKSATPDTEGKSSTSTVPTSPAGDVTHRDDEGGSVTYRSDGTVDYSYRARSEPNAVDVAAVRALIKSGNEHALNEYLWSLSAPPGTIISVTGYRPPSTRKTQVSNAPSEGVTVESIGDLPLDQASAIYREAIDEADVDSEGRVFGIAHAAPGTVSFEQLSGLHAGYSEAVTKHNAELDRKRGAGLDKKDAVALLQSIGDLPVDQATAIYEESIDEDVPFEELYGGYFEKAASEKAQGRAQADFNAGEGLLYNRIFSMDHDAMWREAQERAQDHDALWREAQERAQVDYNAGEGLLYNRIFSMDHDALWREAQERAQVDYNAGEGLLYNRMFSMDHDALWREAMVEAQRRAGQRPLSIIEDEAGLHPAFGMTGQPATPTAQPVHDPFSATPMAQPQVDILGPPPQRREEDTSDHGLFSWETNLGWLGYGDNKLESAGFDVLVERAQQAYGMTPDQARDYVWATHYNAGGSNALGAIAATPLGPALGLTGAVVKTAYKPFVGSIGDDAVKAGYQAWAGTRVAQATGQAVRNVAEAAYLPRSIPRTYDWFHRGQLNRPWGSPSLGYRNIPVGWQGTSATRNLTMGQLDELRRTAGILPETPRGTTWGGVDAPWLSGPAQKLNVPGHGRLNWVQIGGRLPDPGDIYRGARGGGDDFLSPGGGGTATAQTPTIPITGGGTGVQLTRLPSGRVVAITANGLVIPASLLAPAPGAGGQPATAPVPAPAPWMPPDPGAGGQPATVTVPGIAPAPWMPPDPGAGGQPATVTVPRIVPAPWMPPYPGAGGQPATVTVPRIAPAPWTPPYPGAGGQPATVTVPRIAPAPWTPPAPGTGGRPATVVPVPGVAPAPWVPPAPRVGGQPATAPVVGAEPAPLATPPPFRDPFIAPFIAPDPFTDPFTPPDPLLTAVPARPAPAPPPISPTRPRRRRLPLPFGEAQPTHPAPESKDAWPRTTWHKETVGVHHDLDTGEVVTTPLILAPLEVTGYDDTPPPTHERQAGHRVLKPAGKKVQSRPSRSRREKARRPRWPGGRLEHRR